MKIISHRGNINGPVPEKENRPSYIDCALQLGLDVEIDVRFFDGKFWLGHDTADYVVNELWLLKRFKKIWLHCKDVTSAYKLEEYQDARYFCHTADTCVLTSTKHLWVHDLSLPLTEKCIIPLIDRVDVENYNGNIVHGICTDYVTLCKQKHILQ